MFANVFGKRSLVFRFVVFVIIFFGIGRASLAQYGFVPNPVYGSGYGGAWGNYYSASAIQLPSWTASPVVNYPWTNNWQGWQLGATIQNTPSGVLVQQVVPGGIAQIAGLKPGDVIVAVGGSQVGYTNGRVVDLIYEINRRVDVNGKVRLTVLDSASRQMRTYNLNISQRPSAASVVSGRVFLDAGYLPYGNSTIKVELLNVSRPYMTATGGSSYLNAYGQGPFPFSIYTNSSYMNPQDSYRLVATLYDSNRQVIAYGTQDIGVPFAGGFASYDIRLQGMNMSLPNQVTSFGYYYPSQNEITEAFRQYLSREPSASESQAWQQQMATSATSLTEMKAEIIASPAFYDRVGNNPDQFVKLMIESTTRSIAPLDRMQYWRNRLAQLNGDRLTLAREYIASGS